MTVLTRVKIKSPSFKVAVEKKPTQTSGPASAGEFPTICFHYLQPKELGEYETQDCSQLEGYCAGRGIGPRPLFGSCPPLP